MPQSEDEMRRLFALLGEGDRVEVVHDVKIGSSAHWTTTTRGTVVRSERRRHGLHFRRNHDDKVWSDWLVLRRDDGELTTLAIDEYTQLTRLSDTDPPVHSGPTQPTLNT